MQSPTSRGTQSRPLVGVRALPLLPPQGTITAAALKALVNRWPVVLVILFLLGVNILLVIRYVGLVSVSTDDGRVMMFTAQILRDPGVWVSTLPLLQFFTYGALVTLFGWDAPLVLVPLVFSLALALLIGYAAYRMTGGKAWAFLAAALALTSLPAFFALSRALSFHAPTLFFGYAGLFAAISYFRQGGRWPLAAAVLALPAAFYSYNTGLLFLLIPPLYLLVDRGRPTLTRLVWVYAFVGVLATPWLVSHLATFGLDDFYRQRESWVIDRGYLEWRNLEFWGIGSESRVAFAKRLPRMFEVAAGRLIIPVAIFSMIGVIRLPNWSSRSAVLIALAIPLAALLYVSPAGYPRYTYIMLPGLVLLSIYGFAGIVEWLSSRRYLSYLATALGIATIGLLTVVFIQAVDDNLNTIDQKKSQSTTEKERELAQIAELIDDGKAVMGSRVSPLIRYERDSELLTPDFASEEDFVIYLAWESDKEVGQMLERNNVGWLLIQRPAKTWEMNYHGWLTLVTGHLPQHHLKIPDSKLVTRVYDGSTYYLYKVGGGEEASLKSVREGDRE